MTRTAAITGALLITATMLTACGGSGSSVPELDAVADTWEQAGPQFRKDACGDTGEPVDLLTDATLEANPKTFLDDDVRAAAGWFLNSETREVFRMDLDRGTYWHAELIAEVDLVDEDGRELDYEEFIQEQLEMDGIAYLGPRDPVPDPCADSDD